MIKKKNKNKNKNKKELENSNIKLFSGSLPVKKIEIAINALIEEDNKVNDELLNRLCLEAIEKENTEILALLGKNNFEFNKNLNLSRIQLSPLALAAVRNKLKALQEIEKFTKKLDALYSTSKGDLVPLIWWVVSTGGNKDVFEYLLNKVDITTVHNNLNFLFFLLQQKSCADYIDSTLEKFNLIGKENPGKLANMFDKLTLTLLFNDKASPKVIKKVFEWMIDNNDIINFREIEKNPIFKCWDINDEDINKLLESAIEQKKLSLKISVINIPQIYSESDNKKKKIVASFLHQITSIKEEKPEDPSNLLQKMVSKNRDDIENSLTLSDLRKEYDAIKYFNENKNILEGLLKAELSSNSVWAKDKSKRVDQHLHEIIKTLVKDGLILESFYGNWWKGGGNQPIHLGAWYNNRHKHLEVILKAANSLSLESNYKLIELIIMINNPLLLSNYHKKYSKRINEFCNEKNETMLHVAIKLKKYGLIEYIVDNGADLNIKNADNKTPIDLATELGDERFITYFKEVEEWRKNKGKEEENKETFFEKEEKFKVLEEKIKEKTTGQDQNKCFEVALMLENQGTPLETIIKKWNQQKKENYKQWKYEKANAAKSDNHLIKVPEIIYFWNLTNKTHTSEGLIKVKLPVKGEENEKSGSRECYIKIDRALESKLGKEKIEACKKALNNGNYKCFGGLVEVIDGPNDVRVFTDKVYKIEDVDEYLCVLDKYKNHTIINKKARTQNDCALECEKVKGGSCQPNLEDNKVDNFISLDNNDQVVLNLGKDQTDDAENC